MFSRPPRPGREAQGGDPGAPTIDPLVGTAEEHATEPTAFDAGWLATGVLSSAVAQGLVAGAAFLTSVMIARATGPQGKGIVALLLASLAIPAVLANPGLGRAAQTFLARDPARARVMVSVVVTYCVIVGLAGAALIVALRRPFASLFLDGSGESFVWLVAPLLPASMLIQSGGLMLVSANRIRARNTFQIAQSLGVLVAVSAVLLTGDLDVRRILATSAATAVLVAVLMTVYIMRIYGFTFRWERRTVGMLFGYGFRHQGSVIVNTLSKRLEYFFIAAFLDVAAVGIYSVAAAMQDVLLLMPRGLIELGASAFAVRDESTARYLAIRVIRVMLGIALIAVVPIYLAASLLIPAIFGESFAEAVPLFGILLVTFVLYPLGPIALIYAAARMQPGWVTLIWSIASVTNVGATAMLIPLVGLPGNALATVAYYVVLGVGGMWLFLRLTGASSLRELLPRTGDLKAVLVLLRKGFRTRRSSLPKTDYED